MNRPDSSVAVCRQELVEWQRFVLSQSHILKTSPRCLWQLAANQPGESLVCRSAEDLESRGRVVRRAWLRWINKPRKADTCFLTLTGHHGPVDKLAMSCDGRRLVSSSKDGTLRVWDVQSGDELLVLGKLKIWDYETSHGLSYEWDYPIEITKDGRRIITAQNENQIHVYDIENGGELLQLVGHSKRVTALSVDPGGEIIVSGGMDGQVVLWKAESGEPVMRLVADSGIRSLTMDWLGKRVYALSAKGAVCCWECDSGREVFAVEMSPGQIFGEGDLLCLTEDGRTLFRGGMLQAITARDAVSGQKRESLACNHVTALAANDDGTMVIAAITKFDGAPTVLQALDFPSGKIRYELFGHSRPVCALILREQEQRLISAGEDGTIRIWTLAGLENEGAEQSTKGVCIAVSASGGTAVGGGRRGLDIWDVAKRCLAGRIEREALEIVLSPGGEKLVVANGPDLEEWDLTGRSPHRRFAGHTEAITALAATPCWTRLISGDTRCEIRVWDLENGQLRHVLSCRDQPKSKTKKVPKSLMDQLIDMTRPVTEGGVLALAISPDKRTLAATSYEDDGGIRLWDLESGRALGVRNRGSKPVCWEGMSPSNAKLARCLAFSPDGKRFLSGLDDGTVVLWKTSGGRRLKTFWGSLDPQAALTKIIYRHETLAMRTAAFCADNETLLWGSFDGSILRVNAESGKSELLAVHGPREHRGSNSGVHALALSADGRYMISGGEDRRIVVSDLENLKILAVFEAPAGIRRLAVRGATIAATDEQRNVFVLQMCEIPMGPPRITAFKEKQRVRFSCPFCFSHQDVDKDVLGGPTKCRYCQESILLSRFVAVARDNRPLLARLFG